MARSRHFFTNPLVFVAGLLAILPAIAQSAGQLRVCVDAGNETPALVLIRAKALTSRMLATAGLALDWHSAETAVCREVHPRDTVRIEFAGETSADQHDGALAYAKPYQGSQIVVFYARIDRDAKGSAQASNLLAHVMTHEIAHLLQGVARHSETGVMKARWNQMDLDLMAYEPLPFEPADIELIRIGLARRAYDSAAALLFSNLRRLFARPWCPYATVSLPPSPQSK